MPTMPTVNFATEHMDVDVHVKTAKRRVKTSPVRPKDERKLKILESKKWEPSKTRAIQRARDLKYADDGRGEEAEVSMHKEKFNNDEEFRTKRKEYMRQYQQKKREEKKTKENSSIE
jgi:hypothetical protein